MSTLSSRYCAIRWSQILTHYRSFLKSDCQGKFNFKVDLIPAVLEKCSQVFILLPEQFQKSKTVAWKYLAFMFFTLNILHFSS